MSSEITNPEVVEAAIEDDMRAIGQIAALVGWEEKVVTPVTVRRILRAEFGGHGSIELKEDENGKIWCYSNIGGVSNGVFLDGTLDEAKIEAPKVLADKLTKALALTNRLIEGAIVDES